MTRDQIIGCYHQAGFRAPGAEELEAALTWSQHPELDSERSLIAYLAAYQKKTSARARLRRSLREKREPKPAAPRKSTRLLNLPY